MTKRSIFSRIFGGSGAAVEPYRKAEIAPKAKRVNTGHVQQANALSKILNDIEAAEKSVAEREIEVRYSNEQIKSFKTFVKKAEIELENSVRLSNERDSLSEQVNKFSQDNSELKSKLEEERSNLAAAKTSNEKYRVALENARADIIRLMERDSDFREEIETITSDLSKVDAERGALASEAENLRAERQVLSDRAQRLEREFDANEHKLTELKKSYDAVAEERNIIMERQEQTSAEASAALKSLETYQVENAELRSQVSNAKLESDSQRRQYEEKIRIREEEIYSLRAKVSTMQSESRVKDQVLHQSRDDLSIANTEVKASKEIAQKMRVSMEDQRGKAEQYRSQLSDLNTQISVMSVKYDTALVELEAARKENQRLARALKIETQKMEFVFDSSISDKAKEELVEEAVTEAQKSGKPH